MLDLARREPVWVAMATLFLDGQPGEARVSQVARVLHASGYAEEELREIYTREVAPVCYAQIVRSGGGWSGPILGRADGQVDPRWLGSAIRAQLRQRRAAPGWWPFGQGPQRQAAHLMRTDWDAVMRIYRRLRQDPARLAARLAAQNDPATLVDALEGLGALEGRGQPALAQVAELLKHRDFRVRAAALKTAAALLGAHAVGVVVAHLYDDSPTVRSAAIAALHQLLDRMSDTQPQGTDGSLLPTAQDRLLAQISQHALQAVLGQLADGKSPDRLHAARVLERLGPSAAAARPTLLASFGDRNEAVRRALADALVATEPPLGETLAALTAAIFDESARVRQTSALCLGRLLRRGEHGYVGAVSALKNALSDESSQVRESAAAALGWMGEAAAAAVPQLARLARAREPALRASAIFALGQMREAALGELPTLAGALGDSHPEVRRAALRAFARLGPLVQPLAPQFEACLKDPDWLTQFEAQRTLQAVRAPMRLTSHRV